VPLAEWLNHASGSDANVRIETSADGSLGIFALRDIQAGEEISLTYRDSSNEELLATYGFILPEGKNPNNHVFLDTDFGRVDSSWLSGMVLDDNKRASVLAAIQRDLDTQKEVLLPTDEQTTTAAHSAAESDPATRKERAAAALLRMHILRQLQAEYIETLQAMKKQLLTELLTGGAQSSGDRGASIENKRDEARRQADTQHEVGISTVSHQEADAERQSELLKKWLVGHEHRSQPMNTDRSEWITKRREEKNIKRKLAKMRGEPVPSDAQQCGA